MAIICKQAFEELGYDLKVTIKCLYIVSIYVNTAKYPYCTASQRLTTATPLCVLMANYN
jgi:hypothetical protein